MIATPMILMIKDRLNWTYKTLFFNDIGYIDSLKNDIFQFLINIIYYFNMLIDYMES